MRRDQCAEEHAVRGEEGPPKELLVRNAGGGCVIVMVVEVTVSRRTAHEMIR